MTLFGLNVLANYLTYTDTINGRERALEYHRQLMPAVTLVMDDHKFANDVVNATGGKTTVIYRAWDRRDNEFDLFMHPRDWVRERLPLAQGGRFVLACMNEPTGYIDLRPRAAWWAEAMHWANVEGMRLAVPNFAVEHPDPNRIAELDEMYEALYDSDHLLAVHEYARSSPAAEPNRIGRFQSMLRRAAQIGKPIRANQVVITEYGRDYAGGRDDGWRGVPLTSQQYLHFLLEGAALYTRLGILGVCIYCLGRGADDSWWSFNLEGAQDIIDGLARFNREMKPVADFGAMYNAVVTGAYTPDGSAIRPTPGDNTTIMGALHAGDVITISENFVRVNNLNWYKVTKGSIFGYVADTAAFAWERQAVIPDPPPPEPGLGSIWLTSDEINQLAGLHTSIANQHQQIATLLNTAVQRGK